MQERRGPEAKARWLASLLCAALPFLLLIPAAEASDGVTAGPMGISDLSGHVSATYHFSVTRGDGVSWRDTDGVMQGFTVGAALGMRAGPFEIGLEVPYIGPGRQDFTLNLRSATYTAALSYRNVPPQIQDGDRRAEFSLRQTLRPAGAPDIAVDFSRRTAGERTSLSAGITLSDRYRDLGSSLRSLNWQAGYRLASTGTPVHTLQLTVGGQLVSPGATVDFNLRSRYRLSAGIRADQNYLLSIRGSPGERDESISFSIEAEPEGARQALLKASVDYTTGELGRFDVNLGLSAQQGRGGPGADWRLGVGWDLSDTVSATAGYHGLHRLGGMSNGAELGVRWRLNARPWLVNTSVSTSLQFPAAGGFTPSGRASLNFRYQGDALSFSLGGSLNYAAQGLRGRIEGTAELNLGGGGVSIDAGLQLARDTSVNLGVSGHVRVRNSLSLTGSAAWRATFADPTRSVFTLGFGLRYGIGGAG